MVGDTYNVCMVSVQYRMSLRVFGSCMVIQYNLNRLNHLFYNETTLYHYKLYNL